ncbi:hypothetical protein RFI_10964 [Reticulomyxa filosa]|uniref:Arf-GAP domain-containing protein n=1 Tax=Reticulomyxa filosa TaxID=46433 RepID=X6NKA8_RETFI|nr:hypothetical protein RFI_10964 [Reticulomyxa filosa]|eukprot:ETO26174.1 hypothetical protein RFI_10964 [Reticulomyxa filosa]
MPPVKSAKKKEEQLMEEVKEIRKSNKENLVCADCPNRVEYAGLFYRSTLNEHFFYIPLFFLKKKNFDFQSAKIVCGSSIFACIYNIFHKQAPSYVCTNFATFVCTDCSGVHPKFVLFATSPKKKKSRKFGHRVKSIAMANFTEEEVEKLKSGGNEVIILNLFSQKKKKKISFKKILLILILEKEEK